MGLGLFEQGYDLFPLNAGKAVEEILNGIACCQMLEKALHRHARSFEDRLSAHNFRILHGNFAHGVNVMEEESSGELSRKL